MAFLQALLRIPQFLVAQHAAQKLGSLRRGHLRHDGKLLLPGKVGVEELLPGHAEEAGELVGDRDDAVRDRGGLAVEIELRLLEGTNHPVAVRAELEVELDLDP